MKDIFELILKYPLLIIANKTAKNINNCTEEQKEFLKKMLNKILSFGDWLSISQNVDEDYINKISKEYRNKKIVTWRNQEIGHGA